MPIRTTSAAWRLYLYAALLFCVPALGTEYGGSTAPPGLDRQSERIMQVVLADGTEMSSGIVIYPTMTWDWLLPLGELTDALGLAVRISPKLGLAQGFVISESRPFRLDTQKCFVEYEGKAEKYDCRETIIYEDEIYVSRRAFEKWFPADVSVNDLRSQLVITPREKLPEQLRKEREQQAILLQGVRENYDPGYPHAPVPRGPLEGPFIDEQIIATAQASAGQAQNLLEHTTQIGGELLGLEAQSFLSGDQRSIQTSRFNLARRWSDEEGTGPAGLRQIQAFNYVLPQINLLTNADPGWGAMLSSYPVQQPSTFQTTNLQGPLPAGWEVELYRNGVLLDRQVSGPSGRYLFQNVALYYGRNLIRLAFYGPQGERRDEYQNFTISPALVKPGATDYTAAFGRLENSTTDRASLQVSHSLSGNFTTTAGMMHDSTSPRSYAFAGLTGFNELFMFYSNCAFATDGGKACEWGQQLGYNAISAGWKYTRLFNFQSELFNYAPGLIEESQVDANVTYIIPTLPGIALLGQVTKKNYVGGTDDTIFTNRIAFTKDRFYWTNILSYELGSPTPVSGRWELSYIPAFIRYVVGMDYAQSHVVGTDLTALYTVREYAFGGGVRFQYDLNMPTATFTASRHFAALNLGLNLSYSDRRDYAASVLASFSLGRDPADGAWHMGKEQIVELGAASVRVFIDRNRNGVWDEGEPLLPNIRLLVNQREYPTPTDQQGTVFLKQLRPYAANDVAVSFASLNDPFLHLGTPGARFYPRPSKTAQIELPVVVGGQVDGTVLVKEAGKTHAIRGLELELVDGKGKKLTAKTDREGFYSFEDVPPGRYRLHVSAAQLDERKLKPGPSERSVEMPDDGAFVTAQDFTLEP